VCTFEVWMLALRGATSQWKRSRADRLPSAPAAGPPAQITGIAASAARMPGRSTAGSSACSRASSSSIRACRKPVAAHDRITPALMNSPRSTRGTTRTIA